LKVLTAADVADLAPYGEIVEALRQGASLSMGISHPAYEIPSVPITAAVRDSLLDDLIA